MTKKVTAEKKDLPRKPALSGPAAGAAKPSALGRRRFWLASLVPLALLLSMQARKLYTPFDGLHAWGFASWSCFARSHVRYGLGYTKGIMTMAFGDPPQANTPPYFNHPQLDSLLYAGGMAVLGVNEWSLAVVRMILSVLTVLVFLRIIRPFVGDWPALLSGVLLSMLPVTAFFFIGSWRILGGLLAFWLYLVTTGQMPGQGKRRARHLVGLGIVLFLIGQTSWEGYFYAFAIGVHYLGTCIRRREWPRKSVLAVMIVVPLLSLALALSVMAWGFDWDMGRIAELYRWRSAKGEAARFEWVNWINRLGEFAVTNFTWPVLLLAIGYLVYSLVGQVVLFVSRRRGERRALPLRFPLPLLFLLPGLLYLFALRGFFWQHQHAQKPFSALIAIAAALAIAGIGRVLARAGKPVAWVGQIALVLLVGWYCVQGAEHYYSIKWHPPEKIAMWKDLNRLTPPDKKLLSFDVQLDNLIVTQAKAKGPTYRGEPAWYIDREIVQAPSQETLRRSYQKVNIPYAKFVQIIRRLQEAYRSGRVSDQQARDIHNRTVMQMRGEVLAVLRQELPGLLDEIEQSRKTGQFTCYLTPAGYGQPAIGMLLQALNEQLARRYRTIRRIPSRQALNKDGQPVKAGEQIIQFGMRPYCIYDMTQPPKPTSAPATP